MSFAEEKDLEAKETRLDLPGIIDRFRGPMIGLFSGRGVPRGEAEELAQEVFVQAYLSRDRFSGDSERSEEIGPWLRGIAKNLYRNWLRKRKRAPISLDEGIAEVRRTPEKWLSRKSQEHGRIRQEIALLPRSLRIPIEMFYLESCAAEEVANLLGVTRKAVESRLYQARKRLRERLRNSTSRTPH